MPIAGILLSRKWDPRIMLMLGLVSGSMSLFLFSGFNLNSGTWQIFWPQILQGAALAFIFVPLTTVTMDPIANADMGNATSLFNLVRNVGASAGISMSTTLVARRSQFHQSRLVTHLNPAAPGYRAMLAQLQAGFMQQGADAVDASHRALGALYGMLQQQAAVMSFVDTFWLLAVIFIVMAPLVLLMRRPKSGKIISAH
jgi:DHA2 family multidrug resistance protein